MKEQLDRIEKIIKDVWAIAFVLIMWTGIILILTIFPGCTPLEKYRIVQEEECWEGEYIPELDVYTGGCNPTGNYIFERIKE